MKKKYLIIGIIVVILIICTIMIIYITKDNNYKIIESGHIIKDKSNMVGVVLLQESEGSSTYIEQTGEDANSFPTTGYHINLEKSKCENGGSVSYDNTNKKVLIDTNITDKCYIYFDIGDAPSGESNGNGNVDNFITSITIGDVGNTINTITTENAYNLYVQYNGLLYYHEYGCTNNCAEDNSYRYVGVNPNNYVCFGYTDESVCSASNFSTSEYAYRIIGWFDNGTCTDNTYVTKGTCEAANEEWTSNYEIKLRKVSNYKYNFGSNSSLQYSSSDMCWGGYVSNVTNYSNSMLLKSTGLLNSENSYLSFTSYCYDSTIKFIQHESYCNKGASSTAYMGTYYGNLGSTWQNMITTHTWNFGSISLSCSNVSSSTVKAIYTAEMTDGAALQDNMKISIMYASDYLYAAPPEYWIKNAGNQLSYSEHWMKYGATITTTGTSFLYMQGTGGCGGDYTYVYNPRGHYLNPTFYLDSSVSLSSGSGTSSNPYRLSMPS